MEGGLEPSLGCGAGAGCPLAEVARGLLRSGGGCSVVEVLVFVGSTGWNKVMLTDLAGTSGTRLPPVGVSSTSLGRCLGGTDRRVGGECGLARPTGRPEKCCGRGA